jgi:predicted permease
VLTLQLGLPAAGYPQPAQRQAFYDQLEESLRALPEVAGVGMVTRLPFLAAMNNITSTLAIEGRPLPPGERPEIDFRRASSGYFAALGIPLLRGRLVTAADVSSGNGAVLINEAAARRHFPGPDPAGAALGRRISTAVSTGQPTAWQTVVGVVGNVRHLGLDVEPRPEIYYHSATAPPFGPILVVRTRGDPRALVPAVRAKVRALDEGVLLARIATMDELVARSLAQRRFGMLLLDLFAALAVLLAAVGVYGVMAQAVAGRTREIGVRTALGARSGHVLKLILGQGLRLTSIGLALGLAGALLATQLMRRLLFGVSATDPPTFLAVSLLLAAVALLACWLPARRATRLDPMIALRSD